MASPRQSLQYARERFHQNMREALYGIQSARSYAFLGNIDAAMHSIRIAGIKRRIAKGYLFAISEYEQWLETSPQS